MFDGGSLTCPTCHKSFVREKRPGRPRQYCSESCRSRASGSRWYKANRSSSVAGIGARRKRFTPIVYRTCTICGAAHVRSKSGAAAQDRQGVCWCRPCAESTKRERANVQERERRRLWRESRDPRYDKLRARENHKCHKRRVKVTRYSDLRGSDILKMKKSARRCALCSRPLPDDLELRHLDHVWPLDANGTHTRDNVRVLCVSCNCGRPKDGSDVHNFQLNLWMVK